MSHRSGMSLAVSHTRVNKVGYEAKTCLTVKQVALLRPLTQPGFVDGPMTRGVLTQCAPIVSDDFRPSLNLSFLICDYKSTAVTDVSRSIFIVGW